MKAIGAGRGLAFRLRLRGLEVEGAPGVPGTLEVRVAVGLSVHGGSCMTYESRALLVKGGKLDASFTSSDLTPAFPAGRGVAQLCGAAVLAPGSVSFAVAGLIV